MSIFTISCGGLSHTLRLGPNSIKWGYSLNTNVESTYGGRVVQILSCSITDLTVTGEAGRGGWAYLRSLIYFCRDLIAYQKETGEPARLSFPARGWELSGYLANIPYQDSATNVTRPYALLFKIYEDLSGVLESQTIDGELAKIKDGIGYEVNSYNMPSEGSEGDEEGDEQGSNSDSTSKDGQNSGKAQKKDSKPKP